MHRDVAGSGGWSLLKTLERYVTGFSSTERDVHRCTLNPGRCISEQTFDLHTELDASFGTLSGTCLWGGKKMFQGHQPCSNGLYLENFLHHVIFSFEHIMSARTPAVDFIRACIN